MSSYAVPPALICPFTLMEGEALAWSILLFGQAVLLHPYPLPLPVSAQSWADQGMIEVRSLVQTPEAIREKDRLLKGVKQYAANNPGRGFLKYLKEAALMEDQETQEEITGMMKGQSSLKPLQESSIVNGPILLCLIHEWMMLEWDVEASLALIEDQENTLIQGWQESPEEGTIWKSADPLVLKRNEAEIHFPPALAACRELKKLLVPEPVTLFTTQQWVWAEYYGLDPEEVLINSTPLPDLGSLKKEIFQNPGPQSVIRKKMERVLRPSVGAASKSIMDDFQNSILQLGLPPEGKYRLVFPPDPLSMKVPQSSSGEKASDPLMLLLPASI